ncbi:uncharacterized protein BDR25DRAFT_299932 [Lindgomyces ingoldianus]|uniref:Uncharacterized protein n=1 Tax=Lindgomyces ingoldianus TaxID=673940 RepID=A0ACB6RG90_9PLEO|nr:uncharacterized protein BDR25DRAFT_299932 [Lindgomyces ingoldianus]KAF2478303.1 hypothetical protein BDR25DRAFT_299932 [Lindgomyces ingoldianus]
MPSPPLSPPLSARHTSAAKSISGERAHGGGAAYTITEECERLFCETLRAVFLGEGNLARQDSLVLGVQNQYSNTNINDYGVHVRRHTDTKDETITGLDLFEEKRGLVGEWIEIWDYVGGNKFRGFVAEKDGSSERTMFVFFDGSVIGGDLKAGLMALLELCDIPYFSCSHLVACLDRHTDPRPLDALTKDLGWIGFQLTTLNDFTSGDDITSNQWLFMDMDV